MKQNKKQIIDMINERHWTLQGIAVGLDRQGIWTDELTRIEQDNSETDREITKRKRRGGVKK